MGEIECLYELRPTAALGQQAWNIAGRLLRRNTRGLYITNAPDSTSLLVCGRQHQRGQLFSLHLQQMWSDEGASQTVGTLNKKKSLVEARSSA